MRGAVWLLGTASLTLSLGAGPARTDIPFEPELLLPGAATYENDTWTVESQGCTVRLQRLDEDQRRQYLAHAAHTTVDPYASRPDGEPGFLTFLVQVENQSGGLVMLQPERTWLTAPPVGIQSPIGLEALRARFAMIAQPLPAAYEQARPAVLEGARAVEPGESVAGLLMFQAVAKNARSFRVEVVVTAHDGRQVTLLAPYRRPKGK